MNNSSLDLSHGNPGTPINSVLVRRSVTLAVFAVLAASSFYAPWSGVDRGVDDLDTWPALMLFTVAGIAGWAAWSANRRVQKSAGVLAIAVPLLLGPHVAYSIMFDVHLGRSGSSGGACVAFFALILITFVAGIINVLEPRHVAGLPIARASGRRTCRLSRSFG